MFKFQKRYFFCAILIFFIELFIAIFIHDKIIRPYIGDLLVVILLYCIAHSFLYVKAYIIAIAVLIFSFFVEFLQFIHIVEIIGLQKSRIALIIIGNNFSWFDIAAYTTGIFITLVIETVILKIR